MTRIQILAILASLCLMFLTVELIRRKYLEEKYALVWLLTCVFFLLCSINIEILGFLARLTGILVPANFLFLLAFFFLVVICLSLTVVVSRESQKQRRLIQELSLLKFNLEEIKKETKKEIQKRTGLGGEGEKKGSS